MTDPYLIVACPDPGEAGCWKLYFLNTTDQAIERLTIESAGVEWGGMATQQASEKLMGSLPPRGSLEIWRCDSDDAELNPWLTLRVLRIGGEARLLFELPKLYRLSLQRLEHVSALGRSGYVCRPTPAP